jgi:hypothetical protein
MLFFLKLYIVPILDFRFLFITKFDTFSKMQALRAGFKLVDNNKKSDGKRRYKNPTSDRSILPMIDFVDSNGIISPVNNITTWDPFEYDKNEQQQLNDSSRVKNSPNWKDIEHDESKRYDLDRAESVTYSSKDIPATGDSTTRWQPFAEYERNMETLPIEHDLRRQPINGELVKNSSEAILSNDLPPPIKYQTRWQPIEHDEGTQPLSGITTNCFKETKPFHLDSGDTQLKTTNWKGKGQIIKGDDNSVDRSAFQKSDKDNINKKYSQSQPAEIFDPFYIHDKAEFSQQNCEVLFEQCDIFEEKQTDNNLQHVSNETEPKPKQDRLYKEKKKQSQDSQPISQGRIPEYDIEFDDNVFLPFKSMEIASRREEMCCHESKIHHDRLFQQSHIESSTSEFSEGYILQRYPKSPTISKDFLMSHGVATDRNQDSNPCFKHNSASESVEEFDKENELFRLENECDRNERINNERLTSDTLVTRCANRAQERKKSLTLVDNSGCLEAGLGPREIDVEDTGHQDADALEVAVSPRDVSEEEEGEEGEEGGRFDPKLIVLISKFSGTLQQRTKQDRAISILKGKKINNIEEVDGSAPINKDLRNLLFGISGVRGDYPQFFLLNDQDNVTYLGNFDWLEYMNDIGSFTNDDIFGVTASTFNEESPRAEVVDDSPVTATDYDTGKSLSSTSIPERSKALESFKNETIQDDGHTGEIFVKPEKSSCVGDSAKLPIDLVTDKIKPRASRDVPYIDTCSIEIESQKMNLVRTEIEIAEADIDVDDMSSMEPFNTHYVSENDRVSERYVNKLHDAVKTAVPNIDNEVIQKAEDKLDMYMDNDKSVVEESSEEIVRTPSKRKMMLSSTGSLLDTDTEINNLIDSEQVQKISLNVTCSQSVSPTTFLEQSYDVEEGGNNSRETDVNVTPGFLQKIERPLGRENDDDDDDCSKPDVPKVGSDRAREAQERRRKRRWKRLLLSEHDKKQSGGRGKKLSGDRKDGKSPVGSSLNEINMINIFLSVAEPYFDGSGSHLSTQECKELHDRARKAGLTETFTNKMLDQSAGILMYEINGVCYVSKTETSPSGRSFQTKSTAASSSSDYIYDEEGFTRKTPKAESKFGCFKSTFWAESSNIVGAEMIENVKSALSGDSDSVSSRWVGAEMIENVRSALSGDSESVSSRWRSK